jgi:RNA polymerase sigma-70 factor (ECF subfamily)
MREYPAMPRSFAHLSDEAVVALVARSDQEALGELYDRFGRVAYGLALRVLRDDKLAEDAVQEGFLAAWRNADRFMPERAKASTWLLTLVHRRAVDLVRRRTPPRRAAAERASRRRLGRGRRVAAVRARARAGGAAQLPDQQREALELAYYGGFTSPSSREARTTRRYDQEQDVRGLARLRELLAEPNGESAWKPTPPRPDGGLRARRPRPDEAREYEAHLARCERCRDELARCRRPRRARVCTDAPAPPADCARASCSRRSASARTSCRCGRAGSRRSRAPRSPLRARRSRSASGRRRCTASSTGSDAARRACSAIPPRQRNDLVRDRGHARRRPNGEAALVVQALDPAPTGKTYEAWVAPAAAPAGGHASTAARRQPSRSTARATGATRARHRGEARRRPTPDAASLS